MDQPADPKIADKLARMNLAGHISQTTAGGKTLMGKPPKPRNALPTPGEKFEVKAPEAKAPQQNQVVAKALLGKPPKAKPGMPAPGEKFDVRSTETKKAATVAGKTLLGKPPRPKGVADSAAEDKPLSPGAAKGTEIVANAQRAIKEAEQRRAQAIEALNSGPGSERNLNKALIAEEDAALAFHKAGLAYGQAMLDAHSDSVLSAGDTRGLNRLQAELGLMRKRYEHARFQTQAVRSTE